MPKSSFPKKGEIWLLKNLEQIKELSKDYRPVLIISNNERNEYDNAIVVVPLTTVTLKKGSSEVLPTSSDDLENILPVEVFIKNTPETGLDYPSKILCDSPFTWNKGLRFDKKIGVVDKKIMQRVKKAWQIAFDDES